MDPNGITGFPTLRTWSLVLALTATAVLAGGCRFFGAPMPTRTPFPTYTPTLAPGAAGDAAPAEGAAPAQEQAAPAPPVQEQAAPAPAAPTDTPIPPTPAPTATPLPPTLTPTPAPTATPTALPTPTSAPEYAFELEAAEKFPTDSLAPNVVRIYAYVYSPADFGLEGYSLRVDHNGVRLPVDARSTSGLPESTRQTPGPYTRFANFDAILVEPQAGTWTMQLVNDQQVSVGPPVTFELTADEATRELYLRYKLK